MGDKTFRNYFGDIITGERKLAKPEFGIILPDGSVKPLWSTNKYTDPDGFDIRNIEANGDYIVTDFILKKGTKICRYGFETGKYTTYIGVPYDQLALPWDIKTQPYFEYEVIADGCAVQLVVIKGITGPQFGSMGGAVQFLHRYTILQEVEANHTLRRISYEERTGKQDS